MNKPTDELYDVKYAAGLSLVICVALCAGALLDLLVGYSRVAAELGALSRATPHCDGTERTETATE